MMSIESNIKYRANILLEDIAEYENVIVQLRLLCNKLEREFKSLQEEITTYKNLLISKNKYTEQEINKKIYEKYSGRLLKLIGDIKGLKVEFSDKVKGPFVNFLKFRMLVLIGIWTSYLILGLSIPEVAILSAIAFLLDFVISKSYKAIMHISGKHVHIASTIVETILDMLRVPLTSGTINKLEKKAEDLLKVLEDSVEDSNKENYQKMKNHLYNRIKEFNKNKDIKEIVNDKKATGIMRNNNVEFNNEDMINKLNSIMMTDYIQEFEDLKIAYKNIH